MQDGESLPPPRCLAEGLDEEAGGSRLKRRETFQHDVIDVKHLSIVAAAYTQSQVP